MKPNPRKPRTPVPDDVQRACKMLRWEILDVSIYGGDTGYLIRPPSGIIEPYSREVILQSAREVPA